MNGPADLIWMHYVPIGTTIIAAVFAAHMFRRWSRRRTTHVLWWAVGVTTYGAGTLLESLVTLLGNSIFLTKAWYIVGAVLGGYPLAQGSIYLLNTRRFANWATAISLPVVVVTSILVAISPVHAELLQPYRPSGAILAWRWVRLLTPFINTYAVVFLIGGAIVSSWRYYRTGSFANRTVGNALIAIGALLPGIGGSFAKAGLVEALYIGEFLGLLFILAGDRVCAMQPRPVKRPGLEKTAVSGTDTLRSVSDTAVGQGHRGDFG